MKYFKETLYDSICQEFRIDKLYFEHKTDFQHLVIFHNARLGRVMTLDGVVQTTEADEFTRRCQRSAGACRSVVIQQWLDWLVGFGEAQVLTFGVLVLFEGV